MKQPVIFTVVFDQETLHCLYAFNFQLLEIKIISKNLKNWIPSKLK